METIDLHRALWHIVFKIDPSHIAVGAPFRQLLACALCEKSIWRAEIGPISELTKPLFETSGDYNSKHFARHNAKVLFWSERDDNFYRACKNMFDENMFTHPTRYSEHAERDFLAVAASVILKEWSSGTIQLSEQDRFTLYECFSWIPKNLSGVGIYQWFSARLT